MGRKLAPQASWARFNRPMSPLELRGSLSLASLFALRMLGLFLILPVFAVHARQIEGGDSQTLVGMALGAYGLTHGLLQIPSGMASDRYGRKRIIVIGLLVFEGQANQYGDGSIAPPGRRACRRLGDRTRSAGCRCYGAAVPGAGLRSPRPRRTGNCAQT